MIAALMLLATAMIVTGHVEWAGVAFNVVEKAARSGDKAAALEIGRRYETGIDGVSCDPRRALRWYSKAARSEGRARLVYSPPVDHERQGRFLQMNSAAGAPGIPEAARRKAALKARMAAAGRPNGTLGCSSGDVGQ